MSTEDHKQALPPGFRLGTYHVARVLGVGGFGVTYLCEHTGLAVQVAVKEYLGPVVEGCGKSTRQDSLHGASVQATRNPLKSLRPPVVIPRRRLHDAAVQRLPLGVAPAALASPRPLLLDPRNAISRTTTGVRDKS